MAIVRWDPFREFGGAWLPPVDIYSTSDHELVIKAEIPGMNREELDITVENFVILELKAGRAIDPAHEAQLLNYLRATEVEVGLLLNFGPKPEFKRMVFDNERKKGKGRG